MTKTITKTWLRKHEPCNGALEWLEKQDTRNVAILYKRLLRDNHLDWANWAIVRLLSPRNKIKYAIYAAELVIDLYEKEFPNDSRPRQAIEAAKAVLIRKHSKKTVDAARAAASDAASAASDAAWAAVSAASAASEAASAARAAAWAASDAASAARAASDAAWAAVRAASAASDAAMMKKILDYGMKLLKERRG